MVIQKSVSRQMHYCHLGKSNLFERTLTLTMLEIKSHAGLGQDSLLWQTWLPYIGSRKSKVALKHLRLEVSFVR